MAREVKTIIVRKAIIIEEEERGFNLYSRVGGISQYKRLMLTLKANGIDHIYLISSFFDPMTIEEEIDEVGSKVSVSFFSSFNEFVKKCSSINKDEVVAVLPANIILGRNLFKRRIKNIPALFYSKDIRHLYSMHLVYINDDGKASYGHINFNAIVFNIALLRYRDFLSYTNRHRDNIISNLVIHLAKKKNTEFVNARDSYYYELKKASDIKKAQKILINALRTKGDTLISRFVNRPISLAITNAIKNTPITPNFITFLTLVSGLYSAYLVSTGDYINGVIGGVLFHLSSVIDGCDGEIARLKFKSSRFGEWFDNITDEITNLAFMYGVGRYAFINTGKVLFMQITYYSVVFFVVSEIILTIMLMIKRRGSVNVKHYSFDFEKKKRKDPPFKKTLKKLYAFVRNLARNDFMALSLMFAGIFDIYHVAVFFLAMFVTGLFISVMVNLVKKIFIKEAAGV